MKSQYLTVLAQSLSIFANELNSEKISSKHQFMTNYNIKNKLPML